MAMIELLRTNDPVLLSFASSILGADVIPCHILDAHASAVDGSLGVLPRRLVVERAFAERARQLLREAGLAHQLSVPRDDESSV